MSKLIHAAATTVAIFSSVGLAAAQNASNHPDLTRSDPDPAADA